MEHSQAHQSISWDVFIWNSAGKDLIEHHPIGEYITHLIDIAFHTLYDFRGHPAIGSLLSCLSWCMGHAEITDFCKQVGSKNNIYASQIMMDNAVAVEVLHSISNLLGPSNALVK